MNLANTTRFSIHFPDADLEDLKSRLARTRWPDEIPGSGWRYGANLTYMKDLIRYWGNSFDWRAQEAKLNGFANYRAPVAGIDLHFIVAEGKGPNPMPLLLCHGWPGSVIEFLRIIPMLTDPAAHGGDPADSFTVIAPSLPGYGLSFKPNQPRFGAPEIAAAMHELMSGLLGIKRYAAQGGDWGSFVVSRLAVDHPEALHAIHLNLMPLRRDMRATETSTPEERRYYDVLQNWLKEETGYQSIMGTKPQTISYGLTDSPAGLAAWIVEKFHTWSDCGGDVDSHIGRDTVLANISLYWLTGAIHSACWPYYARMHGPWPIPEATKISVPTAYSEFPKEIVRPPRSLAEKVYNIQRWSTHTAGGHFAALEHPQVLATELRDFFRAYRP